MAVPAGEPAQLVERFAGPVAGDDGAEVAEDEGAPVVEGRLRGRLGGAPAASPARAASAAAVCWKIQGLRVAARPIITPSQPVVESIATASSGVRTSPLPITGIASASLSRAIGSQRALPRKPWRAVRPCIATASAPSPWQIRPSSR